jgi:hypothetical protein
MTVFVKVVMDIAEGRQRHWRGDHKNVTVIIVIYSAMKIKLSSPSRIFLQIFTVKDIKYSYGCSACVT